jgi:hypothetical protein
VTAQLEALREAGVGHVILSALPQHVDAVVEGIGTRVLPQLSGEAAAVAGVR